MHLNHTGLGSASVYRADMGNFKGEEKAHKNNYKLNNL